MLLTVGCSPTADPVSAGVDGAGYEASQEWVGSTPAGLTAAVTGGSRRHADDIVVLAGWSRDYRLALRAQSRLLAGRTDGRSQLAAASLSLAARDGLVQDDAAFAALLVRAGELAPDDSLIAWLERLACPASQPACRPERALARLQRLDPDNAATWLAALADAVAGGDQAMIDRTLDRAGQAGHFDSYWGETGHFFDATLATVSLPPRTAAVLDAQRVGNGAAPTDAELRSVHAIAMASAIATPAFAALLRSCRGHDAGVAAARRSSCLSVATLLAHSDTLIGRRIGLGLAVRLTADQPTGTAWREHLRRLLWLEQQTLGMGSPMPPRYAQSLWHVGEIAALQAWMTSIGRPLIPPTGWLPGNAENRALVTTGRPPPRG